MHQLKQINDKILHYKKLQEQAEAKLARVLFKQIKTIFGDDLNLNLITHILNDVWTNGETQKKETWRQQAAPFSGPKRTKSLSS